MLVFVPIFFFASEYAQISLGQVGRPAGVFLLYFFLGFVIAAQIAGRMMDRGGAKRPVVIGCILAAVGFYLWAGQVTSLDFGSQQWYVILVRRGYRGDARAGQYRRRQPRLAALLRRGHRHHPDSPQLRRRARHRHPRKCAGD